MCDLEALEAVAPFSFFSSDIEDRVDEFSTLSVVTLCPVISGAGLAEHKVVGPEELTEGAGSDRVHGSWFKIHEDGSGDIPASSGLIEVDIDSLQLKI